MEVVKTSKITAPCTVPHNHAPLHAVDLHKLVVVDLEFV